MTNYRWDKLKKHASKELLAAMAHSCADLIKDRPEGARPIVIHAYCDKARLEEACLELIAFLEELASAGHIKGCGMSGELLSYQWNRKDADGHDAYAYSIVMVDDEGRELIKQRYPKHELKNW